MTTTPTRFRRNDRVRDNIATAIHYTVIVGEDAEGRCAVLGEDRFLIPKPANELEYIPVDEGIAERWQAISTHYLEIIDFALSGSSGQNNTVCQNLHSEIKTELYRRSHEGEATHA